MSTDTQQSLDALSRALDQAAQVLSEVPADQLTSPTPCTDWDISALIAHLVADARNFVVMAQGDDPDWSVQPSLPDDWAAQFRAGADELLQTWRAAGDEASAPSMDLQTAEFAVHTWDLVRALGQPTDLDPEVAQRGFDLMSGALTAENRGDAFASPVSVADDAPIYDRLAAFAGRSPQ